MGTSELEALKATLANNTRWAGWCTIAVFLGLLVEYTILLWLKRKDLSRTDIILTVIAGVAISLGVGGEYLFGSKASDAAIKIEGNSEQRVADLNKEAGDARKETEALRRDTTNLVLQISSAKLDAAMAIERASQNAKEAARLRVSLANLKLPRHLKWDDVAIKELTPFARTEYSVSVFGDSESTNLADELVAILKGCKWVYKPPSSLQNGITLRSGTTVSANLEIGVRALFNTWRQVDAWNPVAKLFERSGVSTYAFGGSTDGSTWREPLQIIIGQKNPNTAEAKPAHRGERQPGQPVTPPQR